jgi:tryptophan synthase alpha chain
MNRIEQKLQEDKKYFYFSAGYPNLNDTVQIIQDLEKRCRYDRNRTCHLATLAADGPTIQESSTAALHSGMTTQTLFDQLVPSAKKSNLPISWDFNRCCNTELMLLQKNVPKLVLMV